MELVSQLDSNSNTAVALVETVLPAMKFELVVFPGVPLASSLTMRGFVDVSSNGVFRCLTLPDGTG
jgi:hypothetical protein